MVVEKLFTCNFMHINLIKSLKNLIYKLYSFDHRKRSFKIKIVQDSRHMKINKCE